jgi:nicotinate-nucleotide pyrophosphorylase (carboxylating)
VQKVAAKRKAVQKIEVEVRSLEDAEDAVKAGANALLLVGLTPRETTDVVEAVRSIAPKVVLEVAEHISLENAKDYAETGVDYLSVGALTRSSVAVDLSMRITADVY